MGAFSLRKTTTDVFPGPRLMTALNSEQLLNFWVPQKVFIAQMEAKTLLDKAYRCLSFGVEVGNVGVSNKQRNYQCLHMPTRTDKYSC